MSLSPLQQLFQWRRSVRRYENRPVGDAEILSLLEAARLAPSAENAQPWRFVVVRDPETLARLANACLSGIFSRTRFAAQAPVVIALCAERAGLIEAGKAVKDRAMYQLDCGIAGEHVVLRAAELGLGTCWIGWFNRRAARRALGAPFHVQVVALIALGYPVPQEAPRPRPRKPLSSLAWLDRWGSGFAAADVHEGNEK